MKKFATAISLAMTLAGAAASAEVCTDFEGQNVKFIVPYPGGGGYDAYSRAFVEVFEDVSGATVNISNVPAAGGIVGFQAIADAQPDGRTIGIIPATQRLVENSSPNPVAVLSDFEVLGVLALGFNHWIFHDDFEGEISKDTRLVAGLQSIAGSIVEVGLIGHILELDIEFVPGYSGSSELVAAVLRGEVDIVSNSSRTVKKQLAANDELSVALNLTADTSDRIGDRPYFLGEGGLVDQFTRDLSEEDRKARMELADLAVGLGDSLRSIATSSAVPEDVKSCLGSLVEATLFNDDFAKLTKAVKRPISPLNRAAANEHLDKISKLYFENQDLLNSIAQEMAESSR